MTKPVDSERIEDIVGYPRRIYQHTGRAVSDEQTFYILHSYTCLDRYKDLTQCPYSKALDKGVLFDTADAPQLLRVESGWLVGSDFTT